MFNGEFEYTMDEKGRVFLPAKHRELLGNSVYLGRGLDGQINVYPKAVWEEMTRRVEESGEAEIEIRNTSRFLFAASECEVDRQGRIVIPPLLRRYAGLGTDVVILGNKDRVEIWSQERWQQNWDQVIKMGRERADNPARVAALKLNL